jgi:predicted extracellular nuclease
MIKVRPWLQTIVMPRYVAPDNDHLSRGFQDIIPAEYRGTDRFLDVISWNIRWFNNGNDERVKKVEAVLNALNADIIVLEEIEQGSLDKVAEGLKNEGAGDYKVAYGTTGGDQRVAFMYDLEWIRAKDDIAELFGKRTVLTASGKDAFPRLPLQGYFTSLSQESDPFDFQLVGLHLKSQRSSGNDQDAGKAQRLMAAERLKTWLVREASVVDADVVMLGDWNEPPDAEAWDPFRQLEQDGLVKFSSINDNDSISHLMYKNRDNIGSRLDMAQVSISAASQLTGPTEIVRWKSLDALLRSGPTASKIKKYIKEISNELSDHMPLVVRFYFLEQRPA